MVELAVDTGLREDVNIWPIKRGRGRPPGPVPFDKKEHDRIKSAERRARKKLEKAGATK